MPELHRRGAFTEGGVPVQSIFRAIGEFIKKADMLLLSLCITATVYGIVIISSATNYAGNSRYVLIQLVALLLGIALYVLFTLIDVDIIAEGGASFRFIVGKYGSGKSFLLQTIRNYAMDRNFVVVDADLSPERRLQGSHGQGLATYKELIRNMSTKTRPEGGALTLILDRWISSVQQDVLAEGLEPGTEAFAQRVEMRIHEAVSYTHLTLPTT